jgi:uncharacterized membrane protein SpoIIM required for sporulation
MEKDVPYIVYESEAARHERTVKRLLTALIITILLMVGTNMAWLYVFNQYDFSSEEITMETNDDGNNNMLGVGASANEVNNNGIKDNSEEKDSD